MVRKTVCQGLCQTLRSHCVISYSPTGKGPDTPGNGSSERLSTFPQSTQPGRGRAVLRGPDAGGDAPPPRSHWPPPWPAQEPWEGGGASRPGRGLG